jgi:hypothetical protein
MLNFYINSFNENHPIPIKEDGFLQSLDHLKKELQQTKSLIPTQIYPDLETIINAGRKGIGSGSNVMLFSSRGARPANDSFTPSSIVHNPSGNNLQQGPSQHLS